MGFLQIFPPTNPFPQLAWCHCCSQAGCHRCSQARCHCLAFRKRAETQREKQGTSTIFIIFQFFILWNMITIHIILIQSSSIFHVSMETSINIHPCSMFINFHPLKMFIHLWIKTQSPLFSLGNVLFLSARRPHPVQQVSVASRFLRWAPFISIPAPWILSQQIIMVMVNIMIDNDDLYYQ